MTIQLEERPVALALPEPDDQRELELGDWDLDITIVEGGPAADQLIRMTDDGCNSTCATACNSCP
jgi:FxLD family lantipeptide